jgi:tetratricopeptide (TPR) repeat protein
MSGQENGLHSNGKFLSWEKRNGLLLSLFLSAISLKLFIFYTVSTPVFFFKYPFFADKINKGIDIGERILDLSPLYLYGTVLLQKIYGPNWDAMVVFQILTGSLTVVFIFLIGEKIFSRAVGLTAAILLTLYGNLTLFELTLEPDSFVLFFNSLFILTVLWAKGKGLQQSASLAWLLSGVVLGLSIITKANALLFLPGVTFWIWWTFSGWKQRIRPVFFLLLGASLMILPVTLRNVVQFSDPVLVTADMGKVFFHGNGPGATGMERADLPEQGFMEESGGEPDYAHVMFRATARTLSHRNLKPSECSRFWISRTLDHMQTQPYNGLGLLVKKFFLFWQNYEVHDLDSTYAYYQTVRSWPLIPFGFLSVLGIMGMGLIWKTFKPAFLPFLMVLAYLLTVIIFFNASRYRLPAVPFLVLFAGHNLVLIANRIKERAYIRGILLLGTALGLFVLTELPFKKEVEALDRWQQATRVHYNLGGNALFKQGKYKEAIVEYNKAVALAPEFAPAYNQLGKSYAVLNDLESAEKNFLRVVQLSPAVDQGYMNLGFLYEIKGQIPTAIIYFEKAFSLNPRNTKVQAHLRILRTTHSQNQPSGFIPLPPQEQ